MEFLIGKYILSLNLPDYWNFILIYTVEFLIIALFLFLAVFILINIERKILSKLTTNSVKEESSLSGCLKIIANSIKLLFKENIVPDKADKACFVVAPIIVFAPVLFVWTMIPFNTDFCVCKFDGGILLFLAVLLIPVFGMLLGGLASNNKFSIIGGLRSCLQMISYEIPVLISIMSIAVLSESLSLSQIVISQAKYDIFSWYVFPSFLGFLIFFVAGLAQINTIPFDFSDAKSELLEGYKNEYTGIKSAIFTLSEYALFFIICTFNVTLFLGGFLSPFGIYLADFFSNNGFYYLILTIEQIFWLIAKTILLILIIYLIRITLPRLKPENLAALGWKYLVPLSIINLMIVCVIKSVFGGFYG